MGCFPKVSPYVELKTRKTNIRRTCCIALARILNTDEVVDDSTSSVKSFTNTYCNSFSTSLGSGILNYSVTNFFAS